jgi:inhibitor of cysteine peptidase
MITKSVFQACVLIVLLLLAAGCQPKARLSNPASLYCEENGGTLEIREDGSGGQVGYCEFEDGSQCEEWAFFRGECPSDN